jgi:hypothetical protein
MSELLDIETLTAKSGSAGLKKALPADHSATFGRVFRD